MKEEKPLTWKSWIPFIIVFILVVGLFILNMLGIDLFNQNATETIINNYHGLLG